MFYETFVELNSVNSLVISWGKKLSDNFDDVKEIIIFLPGVPGIPHYYITYLETIFKNLNEKIPIISCCNAGIVEKNGYDPTIPPLKGNEHLFNPSGNIKHKVALIENYIPEHVKIHLIGHSFGAYCVLNLMKIPEINRRVHQSYLLFPAIDHVGSSPNGGIVKLIRMFYPLLELLSWPISYLPNKLKVLLLSIYCYFTSIPKIMYRPFLMTIEPSQVPKSLFLLQEILKVEELDVETIEKNVDRMKFYYAADEKSDGWSWDKNYYHLKQLVPLADAHIDDQNFFHCFQFRNSVEMGKITSDWIAKRRPQFT